MTDPFNKIVKFSPQRILGFVAECPEGLSTQSDIGLAWRLSGRFWNIMRSWLLLQNISNHIRYIILNSYPENNFAYGPKECTVRNDCRSSGEPMIKGIAGNYIPYAMREGGFSFDIRIEKNVTINGTGYASQEERDSEAQRVALELGITLALNDITFK